MKWLKKTQNPKLIKYSQYAKFVPSALILVIIGTLISFGAGRDAGFDIVGQLPKGMPKAVNFFALLDSGDFWRLFANTITITVMAFIESIAVASKFADKKDYSIDASQELIVLGMIRTNKKRDRFWSVS